MDYLEATKPPKLTMLSVSNIKALQAPSIPKLNMKVADPPLIPKLTLDAAPQVPKLNVPAIPKLALP